MPSWKIHDKYAEEFGISREVSEEVNKWIDLGPIHDLGVRRLNKKSEWWMAAEIEKVERAILNRIYGYEENTKKLKKIKNLRENRKSAEEVLLVIGSSNEHTKAFILHHMLDMLCNDLVVSSEVLLRSLPNRKTTILSLKTKQNFIETLSRDLERLEFNVKDYFVIREDIKREVFEFLQSRFDDIIEDVNVKEWVKCMAEHRLERKQNPPVLEWIEKVKEKWMRKTMLRYRRGDYLGWGVEKIRELAELQAEEYAKNLKFSELTKWIIDRNNIWEIMRLSGYDFDWASYMLSEIHRDCMDYLTRDFRMYRVNGALKGVPQELSEVALEGLKKDVEGIKESIKNQ